MKRTKTEAAATRDSLLESALLVFSTKGYSATRLDDVARQAGVTRGAIYWHFGGKAELYAALLEAYSDRAARIVQDAVAEGGTLLDILRRVFVTHLAAVESDLALQRLLELSFFKTELVVGVTPELRQRLEQARAPLAGIVSVMRWGANLGELRADLDPEQMARAFVALQSGAVSLWLLDRSAFSLAESAPALVEALLSGIATPGRPRVVPPFFRRIVRGPDGTRG